MTLRMPCGAPALDVADAWRGERVIPAWEASEDPDCHWVPEPKNLDFPLSRQGRDRRWLAHLFWRDISSLPSTLIGGA